MSYFKRIPKTLYELSGNANMVSDILVRVSFAKGVKDMTRLFFEYHVKDGETPELVAHRLYGNANYHWVIVFLNNIIDPYYDWVMSDESLRKFVELKYGTGNEFDTHHELTDDGEMYSLEEARIVGDTVPPLTVVTNFDYENEVNESKRKIKLLRPELLSQLEEELKKLIG